MTGLYFFIKVIIVHNDCLDPQLFLGKSPIPVVISDRKLSFVRHLKYVKKKDLKALNILKTSWQY